MSSKTRLTLLSLILLLFIGCRTTAPSSNKLNPPSLTMRVLGVESMYAIPKVWDGMTIGHYQCPEPGYAWLVVDMEVINNLNYNHAMSPYEDRFHYIDANDNIYNNHITFDQSISILPTYYYPKQTKRGRILFIVPPNTPVKGGHLLFVPRPELNEDSLIVEL